MKRCWSITLEVILGALIVGSLAGCFPGQMGGRHQPDLAVGECVEVRSDGDYELATVVSCTSGGLGVFRVAAILIGDPHGPAPLGTCPAGTASELWSMGMKVEGAVVTGPPRRFCLVR